MIKIIVEGTSNFSKFFGYFFEFVEVKNVKT